MSEPVRTVIIALAAGRRPGPADMRAAFEAILSGAAEPALIAAFLTGLAIRGETTEDIIAGATAMRAAVLRVEAPAEAVDTCGTGGLSWASLNTSTAAAFVAAGAGAVVAKHGNRSKSRAGSADVLEALGVNLQPTEAQLAASFRDARVGFMFAPQHHTAMKHVAPVRAALGIRTIFNMIGPLANPAGAKRQVLGVFAPEWVEPLAHALQGLGSETAWVVHGQDGIDEISTTGSTLVAELKNGVVTRFDLTPEAMGLSRVSMDDLRGGSVEQNAASLRRVLGGEPGPFADLVAVNAAAALVVAGIAPDLKAGIALARESIAKGKAMAAFDALKAASNG